MRYCFDECEFDTDAFRLVVSGRVVPVQPQVADVLRLLIEERDRVVTKEELLDRVWGHAFVTESALTSRIKSARQAIGDDGTAQRLIRTVHGRGYQFVGTLAQDGGDHDADAGQRPHPVPAPRPLPSYGSTLVGRDEELARLADLLGEARVVTIVGPGGVGKTRVAVEYAGSVSDRDVVFVDLTTVRDPDLVVDHVAAAFGLHAAGPDPAGAIGEYVGNRPTLVVTDNVEHVISAAPSIGSLARDVPGLSVLATSRERLRLDGEQVYVLDPLPVGHEPSAPQREPAAIELFVRTARSVAPNLDPERYRRPIEQICATVDGLPLAIELVAGQVGTLPPDMLAARLGDRLRSSSATRRDAPERHRTMSATIEWSLRLLDHDELRLFRMLGAFVGDVTLPLIEAVCADERLREPLEALTRLVDKSLVRSRPGPDGQARFGMLELLRARAVELLAESEEATDVARRHALAVAGIVDGIDTGRWGELASTWTDDLAALLPEFRRAHDTSIDLGEWEAAGLLVASYGAFWHREGGLPEAHRRLRAVLDHADQLSPRTRARALAGAGLVAWDRGDVAEARTLWIASADLLDDEQLGSLRAYVLAGTAVTAIDDPELRDWAVGLLDEALAIARSAEPAALAEVLNMRGEFFRATGDDHEARRSYEEALTVAAEAGNTSVEFVSLANLAYVAAHAGRYDEARRLSQASLRGCVRMGRRLMAAWCVGELAISADGLGEHELAARLIGAGTRAMETLHAGRYPADVAEDEQVVDSLVDRLGQDEFDRLVAEGRALTLDDAISLALEG